MQDKGDKKRDTKSTKKKMSKKKKILISIGIVFLLIILGAGGAYMYIRGQIYQGSPQAETVDYKEQPGITNILLIGTDARKLDEAARADAIIIATIDNNHKKLKLTSIMRDTLVKIPGHGEQKINAALAYGGPELLMQTIKDNFDLSLNKYVMVNFNGFQSIIDQVGGIDVDIKDYEIPELNKFIGEYEKVKSPKIEKPGMQHLDGQQALAYARIRKVGDGDYERTERQRRVIDLVTQKFKDLSVLKYPSVMAELLPYVKTNIEPVMILNYAYTVSKFPSLQFEQLRVPVSEDISWGGLYKDKGWVLIVDKEQNAKMMHDFIFDDVKPTDKSYSVAAWKDKLAEYMGENEQHIKDNGPLPEDKENDGYVAPTKKPSTNTNNNNNSNNNSSKPAKSETPKPETPKPETPKPETPKPETPKPETPKPENPKPENPKPENPKPENPKPGDGNATDTVQNNR
ncbi:LCP family protein [Clostridium sardiniense]|uniref:LCP family protein n=1 Tax=Clostridium sardiniense TaxID=29369 RepID=UPI003D3283B3